MAGTSIARALTVWIPRYTDVWRQGAVVASVIISANLLTEAVLVQYNDDDPSWDYQTHYGKLLAELRNRGVRDVMILDAGVISRGRRNGYSPQLRYYSLIASLDGVRVRTATSSDQIGSLPAVGAVASCDLTSIPAVRKIEGLRIEFGTDRCTAVLVGQDGAV